MVYLNKTTDDTKRICGKFPNVRVIEGEFIDFSATRNEAASHACNDWILSMDADEQLDDRAVTALRQWQPDSNGIVGQLIRHNVFMGRMMRGGQMRPNRKSRLYNRAVCRFEKPVHETLVGGDATTLLPGSILHSVSIPAAKMDFYSSLEGKPSRPLPLALAGAVFAFLRSYILQLGFVDGKPGLCCAVIWARYHLAKYRRQSGG